MSQDLLKNIKKLRLETKAGIIDCRQALEESQGDMKKAKLLLKQKGEKLADKRKDRETKAGLVDAYVHLGGTIASLVSLSCETDFVAHTKEIKTLAHEVAMQTAAMDPKTVKNLLEQEYIRDSSKKIKDLVKEVIAKTGENVKIEEIKRLEV
ncbi:elongation factor Ts [Candidatus Beckwithbacteria bacterium CG10_big_fil_rev_8_21_14_0_10_34_10]|uniref:Elongation factor Ts n=1 Tax=Candidatus Beckwithbacteria bacterium CG10_big_fil_rev_8_21_14_0_10_34_10 TaxID=1974495 RepID=A0A2H0W9U9_9BACT|nr:MAG: elongation factor Ts [Candidatus Beckwithbacteria bacterium CG10_big_fil_rev_8_21_14_0_10_34_10]